jgi:hypothetical protein
MKKPKSKDCPFTHPQIARKFPSQEVHKLCNGATEAPMNSSEGSSSSDNQSSSSAPIPVAGPN